MTEMDTMYPLDDPPPYTMVDEEEKEDSKRDQTYGSRWAGGGVGRGEWWISSCMAKETSYEFSLLWLRINSEWYCHSAAVDKRW